ncbi:OmpA family protein [Reichenbachiella versicolor]|uniref:OmpA family protein n=1 Tax=Reichenbachiella versicolor TaxID=1821036 RepID=UPI0013A546C6|nr:OmpA family protein [Reichenbachiella versicolor]
MRKVIVLICWLLVGQAFGQSVPQLLKSADKQFENNRFLDAIPYYDKVYGIDKKNAYAGYQLALCYEKTLQYKDAMKKYKKLSETTTGEYQTKSIYKYATLNKLESNFEIADSIYQELAKISTIEPALLELANRQREGCLIAMREKEQNRNFEVRYIKKLNDNFHDFGATENPVNGHVVFATTRNLSGEQYVGSQFSGLLPDMMMFEKKKNGSYSNISNKQRFDKLNTKWSEGSGCFNQDGNRFYFTSCENEGNTGCRIMVSVLENEKWKKAKPLNAYINEKDSENKQPSLSVTGDTLFFSSNRPGGFGGSDIWMSLRGDSIDAWTPAINMGDIINTPENEISPYYSSAHESLLFSSNGHVGYGGYDIYGAKGASFFKPDLFNVGYPFNSTWDDTYFNISDSTGYLSSNRKDKEVLNLYDFHVPDEKLFLSLVYAGEMMVDGQIISKFSDADAIDLVTFRAEDYEGYELFQPVIAKKKDLRKLFNESDVAGNSIASNFGPTRSDGTKKSVSSTIKRTKRRVKKYRTFDNVERLYFDYGQTGLRKQSKQALHDFYDNLGNQPYTKVNLLCYADHHGSHENNIKLSERRGKAVKEYLVSMGMPIEKVHVLARGEARSAEEKDHWFRRVLDRRVELHVETNRPIDLPSARGVVIRKPLSLDEVAAKLDIPVQEVHKWNGPGHDVITPGHAIRLYIPSNRELDANYFITEENIWDVF